MNLGSVIVLFHMVITMICLQFFFFFFFTTDASVNIYVHKSWCSCVIISIGSVLHVKLLHQMFLKLMIGVSGA